MSAETYRYEHYDPQEGTNSAGPGVSAGNSAYNGPGEPVRHGWFCWCSWCLAGHK